jgi:hypothetical protein
VPNVRIKGSLTILKGDIFGNYDVEPGGNLNIDIGNSSMRMGKIVNRGTFNWRSGRIRQVADEITNAGLWNIATGDTLSSDQLFEEKIIVNTGRIVIAPGVSKLAIFKGMRNTGSITLGGPDEIALYALDQRGSISGPVGSTVNLSGNFFGTSNVFRTGSTVAVSALKTADLTQLNIESGVNLSQISDFTFNNGNYSIQTVLPPNANYIFQGGVELGANMVFNQQLTLNGSFNGNVTIEFATTQANLSNAVFGEQTKVLIRTGAIVTVQNLNTYSLINNGTLNWTQSGTLTLTAPGMINNGICNISADSMFALSTDNKINWLNKGTLNITGRIIQMYSGLQNDNQISVASNSTLEVATLQQKGTLTGQTGSTLRLFNVLRTASVFHPGAVTSGFSTFDAYFATAELLSGTTFSGIEQFLWRNSEILAAIVLPPTVQYRLENTRLRLRTNFEPQTVLQIEDSDIEGSGNLRIGTGLLWDGGTLDVPVRVLQGASVSIREGKKRPIISAPFINEGVVTLSGGIVEINTGFFKNSGSWNVNSEEEDVIIDGFTGFTNDGNFAICSGRPIQISFNVPFTNNASGTFQGTGSYTFNAGFTNAGVASPGCSPGMMTIQDNFNAAAGVNIEIAGDQQGQYDQLRINGNMKAEGILRVSIADGLRFSGTLKVIETIGRFEGTFAQVILPSNCRIQYEENGVSIISDGSVSTHQPGLSTKPILMPSLAAETVTLHLPNPISANDDLQIFNAQGQLVRTLALPQGSTFETMNVEALPVGAYFVRMAHQKDWTGKFWRIPYGL